MLFFWVSRWFLGLFGACRLLMLIGCETASSGKIQANPTSTANVPTLSSARLTYNGHNGAVSSIAWSPDGKEIASSDLNGAIQVWQPGL